MKIMDSIKFEVHWYRRVFHTFGSSFLVYYIIPDTGWSGILKRLIPTLIILFVSILEYLRITGKISSNYFFGLRVYEEKRVGSYLFFGVAVFILLLFFPQQIAVPCILCACFTDPIMGETRQRYGGKNACIAGFFVSMFFFIATWYRADIWIRLLVSIVGGTSAVIGEAKKNRWIDDDFMVQILPAVFILILWRMIGLTGLEMLPSPMIHPI
ncbi:MAG TPA: dolichol kinase [Thermoplasmatales archaeon]|nr:MAG: dolichol kinase [Thermoplasmata archaeon]RLF35475.1 MAG: dolichol kinase [Thermoplasmata archaeon]HDO70102.1 dolichol kinase [Thermoplasmatales archaeon]HEX08466.1 dolichol kinase [Thermoplasmatales archaeon]